MLIRKLFITYNLHVSDNEEKTKLSFDNDFTFYNKCKNLFTYNKKSIDDIKNTTYVVDIREPNMLSTKVVRWSGSLKRSKLLRNLDKLAIMDRLSKLEDNKLTKN